MNRNEIEKHYQVQDGRIVSPGKFEGEPIFALKLHFPFRIVWGAINPQDQSFEAHADHTRVKLNSKLRKGWLVATVN